MITCPGCRKVVKTHYNRHMVACPDITGVRPLYAAALVDPVHHGHIRNRTEYSALRPDPLWSGESLCKHYGETWAGIARLFGLLPKSLSDSQFAAHARRRSSADGHIEAEIEIDRQAVQDALERSAAESEGLPVLRSYCVQLSCGIVHEHFVIR